MRAPVRAAPPPAPSESGGIAHLRGRLFLPAGVERTNELLVVAEAGVRQFHADIPDDDTRYEIHLPSGRYTLVAAMGELGGVVPDVLARAGAPRDVDIRLAVGESIRGKVKAPSGAVVHVSLAYGFEDWGNSDVKDGRFSIAGLLPGRPYEITFNGSDVRKLTIAGVTAPADGLDVEVVPAATVSGAIGFPRGGRWPVTR